MFFTNLETTNPEIFLQVENEFCYLPCSKVGPYLIQYITCNKHVANPLQNS